MANHRFDDDDDIYGSDDKNKKIKRIIFWLLQGILAVFFILISYEASKIIFSDILHLTLEKFPTIYLVIPFGIFLFLVLLDVLLVYLIKYFMARPPSGSKKNRWIRYKNIIILVSAHILLGILFLAISLGLSYLLFYTLSRWEHEPDFLLIVLVTFFLFILQIVWYVKSCAISVNSTEMGVKRVFQSPRKIIREGLNLLWWIVEDLILVPRERFEIEFLVDGVRTEPDRILLYKYKDENGKDVEEYDEVDRQEVIIELGIYASFGEDEESLLKAVRYLPADILATMRNTITNDEILSLIKFEKGVVSDNEKKEILESYRMRPLAPEQRKYLIQIAIKRHYDTLIKNLVRQIAAGNSYPGLDKMKEDLSDGIKKYLLEKDETFNKTGLSHDMQVLIGRIILPDEVEKSIVAREASRKKKQADIAAAEARKKADMLNADAKSYEGMKQADVRKYEKRTQTEADLEALGLKDPKSDGVKPGKEDTAMKLVAMMETLGAIKESDFKIFEAEGASKVFERIVDHNLEKFIKKS